MRGKRFFALSFCFVSLSLEAGTSKPSSESEIISAWNGRVWSSAEVDDKGMVQSLTLNISMDAIRGVPEGIMESTIVPLPESVQGLTFFDHISLDWNPHGHEPLALYQKPHFDIHFYHPTVKEVAAIDCSSWTEVAAELIPEGYALPPDLSAAGSCVPQMGFHAAPVADFAPDFAFGETFIYGYYEGELSFFEPMITQDFFLEHNTVEKELDIPQSFGFLNTQIPHAYTVIYDEKADTYRITFNQFQSPAKENGSAL